MAALALTGRPTDQRLSPDARRVLAILCAWPSTESSTMPRGRDLKPATGLTRPRFAAALRELNAAGALTYDPATGTTTAQTTGCAS